MSFWNLFNKKAVDEKPQSHLQMDIKKLLPTATEETQIIVACVAGLMARVAYSDMNVEPEEVSQMNKSLSDFSILNHDQIEAVTQVALKNIKSLCGIENHMYTDPLSTMLDNSQRLQLLVALFKIAASDGRAEQIESEEIRLICKGLLLEHKHFIAARATVAESLEALKSSPRI